MNFITKLRFQKVLSNESITPSEKNTAIEEPRANNCGFWYWYQLLT